MDLLDTRPVFPLDLALLPGEASWLYDDSPAEIGLNGPATLAAQAYAKQRVQLAARSVPAAAREQVEAWLATAGLDARSVWIPCDLGEATLLAVHDAGARQVRIAGQDWTGQLALAAGMVLRLLSPAGEIARVVVEAVATDGADEIVTLDVWPAGLAPGWHVSRLLLARLTDLSWRHHSEGLSDLDLTAVELPAEYSGPGAADAAVRVDAWLYILTRRITSSDVVCWRMTSAPEPIEHDGASYVPAQIDHDKIATSTEGDTDQLSVRMGDWPANPFREWFPRHAAGSYGLVVERVRVDRTTGESVGAAVRAFRGEVASVVRKGPVYTVTCKSPLAFSTARTPGFMIQTFCNYALYDPNTCGVPEATWRLEGTIEAISAASATVDFECADLDGLASDWLVRGYIAISIGDEVETRFVRSSASLTATRHRLFLNMPAAKAVVGAAAAAQPGCDKSVTMCHARYANRKRFGGHPFLPSYNPSIAAIKPPVASGGGKK